MKSTSKKVLSSLVALLVVAGIYWKKEVKKALLPASSAENQRVAVSPAVQKPLAKFSSPASPQTTDSAGRNSRESVWVEASWGAAPGQLGHSSAAEASPEDPMSMAVGPHGELCVLDQVNDRVQCFGQSGTLGRSFPLSRETAQDLLLASDGSFAVLDRLGQSPALLFYSAGGKLAREVPLLGGAISEGGGITALLSDTAGNYYIEVEHREVVRVADRNGEPDKERPSFPGRPTRDGSYFVTAALKNAVSGVVTLQVFMSDKTVAWQKDLDLQRTVSHLVLLASDKQGHIYVGAVVRESGDARAATLVVRLQEADGMQSGTLLLPAHMGAEERFRDLVVTDDGYLVQLQSGPQGAKIKKYLF